MVVSSATAAAEVWLCFVSPSLFWVLLIGRGSGRGRGHLRLAGGIGVGGVGGVGGDTPFRNSSSAFRNAGRNKGQNSDADANPSGRSIAMQLCVTT